MMERLRKMFEGVERVHHWSHGIYFIRHDNGDVSVCVYDSPAQDAKLLHYGRLPEAEWVSVVAACSRGGENAEIYEQLLGLHRSGQVGQPQRV